MKKGGIIEKYLTKLLIYESQGALMNSSSIYRCIFVTILLLITTLTISVDAKNFIHHRNDMDIGFDLLVETNSTYFNINGGGSVNFTIIIENTGAIPETITLSAESNQGWPVSISMGVNDVIFLIPNESIEVNAIVVVPPGLDNDTIDTIIITGTCDEKPSVTDTTEVIISVIAKETEQKELKDDDLHDSNTDSDSKSNQIGISVLIGMLIFLSFSLLFYWKKRNNSSR